MLFQPSAKVARISIFTIVHHQRRHSAAFRNAVFILSVVDAISSKKSADAMGFKIMVLARPERGGCIVIRRRQITQSKIFILKHMFEPLPEERQCRI
jgi:hypothetical protein